MRKTAFIAAIVVCSAQAWAADDAASGIQKSKDQYMAAFNKGDAGAVAQLYTQQATENKVLVPWVAIATTPQSR